MKNVFETGLFTHDQYWVLREDDFTWWEIAKGGNSRWFTRASNNQQKQINQPVRRLPGNWEIVTGKEPQT